MTARTRKIVRDLRSDAMRIAMIVVALATGIATFTATLSAYAILKRELRVQYLATNPASATVVTDVVDAALLREIATSRDVARVEARRVLTGRIRGRDGWHALVLFVIPDPGHARIAKISADGGAWPSPAGTILIERDALQVAHADVGDVVTVRLGSGVERQLRVAGKAHDVGQAQARMENVVYAYASLDTLPLMGESPSLDRVLVIAAGNRFDLQHVRNVAGEVAAIVRRSGHPVRAVSVPTPGEHPHGALMGTLLLVMSTFGILLVLLAAVSLVNLFASTMAAQVREIGILKAIGGSRTDIAVVFGTEALAIGVMGISVGLLPGVAGARALCGSMARFLNFDISSFAIPFWVFAVAGALAVVVPLFAAAVPIIRGSAIPIRVALSETGVTGREFGASLAERIVARWSRLPWPLLLVLRDLVRRRRRLTLTVGTLALAGLFYTVAWNVRASAMATIDRLFETKPYDLTVTLAASRPAAEVLRAMPVDRSIVRVEGGRTIHARTASAPGIDGHAVLMAGIPARSQFFRPHLDGGRTLEATDADAVVINSAAARTLSADVGSRIVLTTSEERWSLKVVGIAREPVAPPIVYVPLRMIDGSAAGGAGTVDSVHVALLSTDAVSIERGRTAIERRLRDAGIPLASISSKADMRIGFDQHMLMMYVFLLTAAGLLALVGGLGLSTSIAISVLERRRELGVLRAIGGAPRSIVLLIVTEGVAVAVVSWAVVAVSAWPATAAIGSFLFSRLFGAPLEVRMPAAGAGGWLLLSVLIGVAASIAPAASVARLTVREALAFR